MATKKQPATTGSLRGKWISSGVFFAIAVLWFATTDADNWKHWAAPSGFLLVAIVWVARAVRQIRQRAASGA